MSASSFKVKFVNNSALRKVIFEPVDRDNLHKSFNCKTVNKSLLIFIIYITTSFNNSFVIK